MRYKLLLRSGVVFCQIMWKIIAASFFSCLVNFFVITSLLLCQGVMVAESIHLECGEGSSHEIRMKYGIGKCVAWGGSTKFGCCLFCNQEKDGVIAARVMPIGGINPFVFGSQPWNQVHCCCYYSGELVNGGDGSDYYYVID